MEITQQLREFAAEKGLDTEEAVQAGLTSKSKEFEEAIGEIYSWTHGSRVVVGRANCRRG